MLKSFIHQQFIDLVLKDLELLAASQQTKSLIGVLLHRCRYFVVGTQRRTTVVVDVAFVRKR